MLNRLPRACYNVSRDYNMNPSNLVIFLGGLISLVLRPNRHDVPLLGQHPDDLHHQCSRIPTALSVSTLELFPSVHRLRRWHLASPLDGAGPSGDLRQRLFDNWPCTQNVAPLRSLAVLRTPNSRVAHDMGPRGTRWTVSGPVPQHASCPAVF